MLTRFVCFASVGLLMSAFAASADAAHQHCTQVAPYNKTGAVARVRTSFVPMGTSCAYHRRQLLYSSGCVAGVCVLGVDQQPFTVLAPTSALAFKPWRYSSNFFGFPQ